MRMNEEEFREHEHEHAYFILSPTDAHYTIAGVPYMYIYIHVANTLHNIVMIVYFSNLCQPTRDIKIRRPPGLGGLLACGCGAPRVWQAQ